MIGVYKITSPTGKVYVGSSLDVHRRIRDHKSPCRLVSGHRRLSESLRKYGIDTHVFEVVLECSAADRLDKENRIGNSLGALTQDKGLNSFLPRSSKNDYPCISEETRKVMADSFQYRENTCRKLSSDAVSQIKMLLAENRMTQKDIGEMFGVSNRLISSICRGTRYASVAAHIKTGSRVRANQKIGDAERNTIYRLYETGVLQREIAERFGVTQTCISRIVRRKKKT
jgi:group I intron endonuclease